MLPLVQELSAVPDNEEQSWARHQVGRLMGAFRFIHPVVYQGKRIVFANRHHLYAPAPPFRRLKQALAQGQPVARYASLQGEWYVVIMWPVRDIAGRQVAYLISYGNAPEIAEIQREFWLSALISALMLTLLGVLLWRALKEAKERQQQQDRLQTIADTLAEVR